MVLFIITSSQKGVKSPSGTCFGANVKETSKQWIGWSVHRNNALLTAFHRMVQLFFSPLLFQIEQQLTLEKLREWTQPESLDLLEVRVQLPRFKLEESYDLSEPLARLGARDLFGSKADLSGMSGASDLFISKVVHKSVVDVNEEGTEAAAATGAIAQYAMLMPEEEFVADHPFIFFIRHKPSSHILFLGRLSFP